MIGWTIGVRGAHETGVRTTTSVPQVRNLVQAHRKIAAHFSRRTAAFKRLEEIGSDKGLGVVRFVAEAETRVASMLGVVQTNLRNWETIVEYFSELRHNKKTTDAGIVDLLQTTLTPDLQRQSAEIEAVLYVLSQGAFLFQEEWRVTKSWAWYEPEKNCNQDISCSLTCRR